MRQRELQPRSGFIIQVTRSPGGRGGGVAVEQFGEFRRLVDARPEVHFGEVLPNFAGFIPFREAAGDHQTAAFGGAFPLDPLVDCRKRLFPRGGEEGAGVDHIQIGLLWIERQRTPRTEQCPRDHLRVNEILGAAEAD